MFNKKAPILLIAGALLIFPLVATAQSKGVTTTAAGKGGVVSVDVLVSRYTTLAGSAANAKSLVNGLRTGADISLTGLVPQQVTKIVETTVPTSCPKPANPFSPPQTNCTTKVQTTVTETVMVETTIAFSPRPAAPMGLGNVDIAVALTEARLNPVTAPTPQQLKDALLDILGRRAGGDGWGEIAKSLGFDLK